MKKATKEKKPINNRKKVNKNAKGIFDYEQEVKENIEKPRKKLTKKANSKNKNVAKSQNISNKKEQIKNNKKKIKKLQKRKKEENIKKKKVIKKERERQKREINQRLTLKQIRQKKKNEKTVRTILITLIIMGMLVIFALSPIFYIKEIRIIGNEKVPKQEIISLLKIENNINIFKENESKIKEKLKENPYIDVDKIKMRRILPEILEITISERIVEYLLEFGNSYAYLDKNGYILEISTTIIENKFKISGYETQEEYIKPGNRLNEKDLAKLNDVSLIISVSKNFNLDDKISLIDISNSQDYLLHIESENKIVHLGDTSSLDTKMLYIKAILEKEKGNDGEIYVNIDLNKKNAYFKQNV